jgi:hypothetical protein
MPVCLECTRSREFLAFVLAHLDPPAIHLVFPELEGSSFVGGLDQPLVTTGNCIICDKKTAFKALGQSLCLHHLDPYGIFVAAIATYGLIYEILSAWTYFGKPSPEQFFNTIAPNIRNLAVKIPDIPEAKIAEFLLKTVIAIITRG